jgi:hypothetical protein
MARRLRLGPAGGPKILGAVAAAVLVLALVLTGRALNGGSGPHPAPSGTASTQAPHRSGGRADCPPGWPVLAMANHTSYPPGHPGKPPSAAAAVACYQTTAQAASAGYAPAPLPPGALEVGGVYLAPTSRGFRAGCRQVADRLGFAVPCPGLLPSSPPGAPPPRLCGERGTCRRGQLLLFSQDGFEVPLGYVGLPNGQELAGALAIAATPTRGATGRFAYRCPDERRIATPIVQGTRALLVACPEADQASSFGGSVLLRWSQRDTLVTVSVLGWSEVNQRLVVALAEHLRLIPPRS